MSWNHSTEYKLPEFQSIGAGAGIGGFEKVYDTSELPGLQSISVNSTVATSQWHACHLHVAKGDQCVEQDCNTIKSTQRRHFDRIVHKIICGP